MDKEKSGFGTKVKEFFSKTGSRIKMSGLSKLEKFKPDVNENGLITDTEN